MNVTIVRYRVKPGRAEENAELVRAVYAELDARDTPGFRYITTLADDGVSFTHFALLEDGAVAPLGELPAFQRFSAGVADRCDEPPQVTRGAPVGHHGF